MISGFIAKKGQMTNIFQPDGTNIAVTKLICLPLVITQIKTKAKDGYQSVQIAYGTRNKLDKATSARLAKNKLDIKPQHFKEFDLTSEQIPEVGNTISADTVFTVGEIVDVTGVSKGHGFAGVIKRYGFQRQPVTGGQSDRVRAPGAIGAQTPGKVIKGKKMPGHYGNVNKTVTNLTIIAINQDKNELLVKGPVPGSFNSWVTISKLKA